MTSTASATRRLDGITGLRWWAAFAVFAFHMPNLAPLPGAVANVAAFGQLGVTFFFVLSGFVLTWSWRPTIDKRTFYWRRFARIYPLHVVTLLLAIPVFYSFSPDPSQPWVKPFDAGILLLCLFLLQGWSRDPTILFAGNPASWTLTAEAFFYSLHPFITRPLVRLTRNGALIAAAGVIAFAFATRLFVTLAPTSVVAGLPWPVLRLNEFVLGMCLAWAFRQGFRLRLHVSVPAVLILGWIVALIVLREPADVAVYAAVSPYTNEVTTVLCALLIASVATSDLAGRSRLLAWRPVVALGEWSYAFYLIHATIIYGTLEIVGRQPGGWVGLGWFMAMLGLSIAASWALHGFIERPTERRLRAWQTDRRARRERRSEVRADDPR